MSTFSYLNPSEILREAREDAPEWRRILGLRAVDADRIPHATYRTNSGYARENRTFTEHGHLDKFKAIERAERAKDANWGMVEVFYTDGSTDLIGPKDLLCVERPVKGV